MISAFAPLLPLGIARLATERVYTAGTTAKDLSMRRPIRRRVQTLLVMTAALFPNVAHAGQLGWLRNAARDARQITTDFRDVASKNYTAADRETAEPQARACGVVKEGTPLPLPGHRPEEFPEQLWPTNCAVSNLDNFDFSRGQKLSDAYHAASAIRCDGCTGTTVTHDDMVYGSMTDRQFGYQMGQWAMDKDVTRPGRRYVNVIHPVGEFMLSGERCKVFQWTLRDGERQLAEKYSLVCLFAGPYQRNKHWNALVL